MHRFTRITRTHRFIRINNEYNLIHQQDAQISLELTGRTDLRKSAAYITSLESTGCTGLQELTERIGLLKLKEYSCLLRLTEDKGLQTLTGHTGLLKFPYTDNKVGN